MESKYLQLFSEEQQQAFRHASLLGQAAGYATSILRVLQKRGLAVSDAQREKVLACTELPVLEGWLDRAVTAASTDEIFV